MTSHFDQFSSSQCCNYKLTKSDLQQTYDFVAEYDPKQIYTKKIFQTSFGDKPVAKYAYMLLVDKFDEKFVVAKLVLTDKQCETLAPYCQCAYHQCAWYNPMKMFMGPIKCGCVEAGAFFASDYNMQQAIQRYNLHHSVPFAMIEYK
jgi:hypothetical protein